MIRLKAAIRAAVVTLFALFVLFYAGMSVFYGKRFLCGTFINDISVTGMTVAEAEAILPDSSSSEYTISIRVSDNKVETISGKQIGAELDYRSGLQRMKNMEIPFLWAQRIGRPVYLELAPEVRYDKDKAISTVLALDVCRNIPNRKSPKVIIKKGDDGKFILIDTVKNSPDREKLVNLILKSIRKGERNIDLREEDYYTEYRYTDEMKNTIELYDRISTCTGTDIAISDNGITYCLSDKEISDMIMLNANGDIITDVDGELQLDSEKLDRYIHDIYERFTTEGKVIYWKKFGGGTVSINSGVYGRTVDKDREKQVLTETLRKGIGYAGKPEYLPLSGNSLSADVISDNYIEVDMTAQKLYYIKNGRLFMQSDVVTGALKKDRATPQMMAYIYEMQKDRVLVGEDYRTPVKFWMAVHGHIGLHDADWRSTFGGSIYEKSGSHGCINLPPDFAEELYDNVHIGLPVICYY